MPWEVEYTDEFGGWWEKLSMGEQESVVAVIGVLGQLGPQLSFPYSSDIKPAKKHAIRAFVEWPSSCLEEIRPETIAGMTPTSHGLRRCLTSTWLNCERKGYDNGQDKEVP